VDESADEVAAADRAHSGRNVRRLKSREVEATMGPSVVVMPDVLGDYPLQVSSGKHEQVVEAVLWDGTYPALGEGVRQSRQLHLMETVRPEPSG